MRSDSRELPLHGHKIALGKRIALLTGSLDLVYRVHLLLSEERVCTGDQLGPHLRLPSHSYRVIVIEIESKTDLSKRLDDLGDLALFAPSSAVPSPAGPVRGKDVFLQGPVIDLPRTNAHRYRQRDDHIPQSRKKNERPTRAFCSSLTGSSLRRFRSVSRSLETVAVKKASCLGR